MDMLIPFPSSAERGQLTYSYYKCWMCLCPTLPRPSLRLSLSMYRLRSQHKCWGWLRGRAPFKLKVAFGWIFVCTCESERAAQVIELCANWYAALATTTTSESPHKLLLQIICTELLVRVPSTIHTLKWAAALHTEFTCNWRALVPPPAQ